MSTIGPARKKCLRNALATTAGWSYTDKSLKSKFTQKGLVTAFRNTIKNLEEATNNPAHFHEWRATKTDKSPLTSSQWKYKRSNFKIDLDSKKPAAD